eukprot:COSAG06_NODE_38699_length_420_cov_1.809969_1_plen_34_part_10
MPMTTPTVGDPLSLSSELVLRLRPRELHAVWVSV